MLIHNRPLTISNAVFSAAPNSVLKALARHEGFAKHLLEVAIATAFAWLMTAGMLLAIADSSF